MPLQRAKDSILSLQELALSSKSSQSSSSSSCIPRTIQHNVQQQNQHQQQRTSWLHKAQEGIFQTIGDDSKFNREVDNDDDENDEKLVYWKPNESWSDYEEFYKMKKLKKIKPKANDCCHILSFCHPGKESYDDNNDGPDELYDWTASDSDDDDDDDNSHDENHPSKLDRYDSMMSANKREGGIAKRASMAVQLWLGVNEAKKEHYSPKLYKARPESHSSLISSDTGGSSSGPITFHVRFAPYKQVVPICPIDHMTKQETRDYWWQLQDFDHFKTEISLLAKPEEQEAACTVWLANNQKTTNNLTTSAAPSATTPVSNNKASTATKQKSNTKKGASTSTSTSTTTKQPKAGEDTSDEKPSAATAMSSQSSWWHKYGDSRRGLEKIASSNQAKQTLQSYRTATRKVLQEQRRQKFWKETPNPEKIAHVYLDYTAWSRDLALAAAASDADALRTNFDDSKRKSREFFLLKQIYKNQQKIHKHMPEFMVPKGLKPTGFLDEHDQATTYTKVVGDGTNKPNKNNKNNSTTTVQTSKGTTSGKTAASATVAATAADDGAGTAKTITKRKSFTV